VLQEIIQETTNRLNRLAKQESENEIRLSQVNGDIDAERVTGELLTIKHQNAMSEAQTAGAAEAARAAALLTGLGDFSAEDKLAVFFTLRKQDMLSQLSKGNAQLFFTPDQANISIETQAARA
jgi:hypothetical protein